MVMLKGLADTWCESTGCPWTIPISIDIKTALVCEYHQNAYIFIIGLLIENAPGSSS